MGRKCVYFLFTQKKFAAKNISLQENEKKSYLKG
jgi:hypothetical protein